LTAAQRDEASRFFDRNVSPALTPLGLDPAHPFPFVSNLSTNWGFILHNPDTDEYVPVRVKIPTMLPSWIPLKADVTPGERRFLRLEDLIRHSADKLFPGMKLIDATLFRILRNAEICCPPAPGSAEKGRLVPCRGCRVRNLSRARRQQARLRGGLAAFG
jgi:polyphosphate kinase